MSQAVIDHWETLDADEVNGAIMSLTRLARVIGLTNTDYNILWSALGDAGIPAAMSTLAGSQFSGLVLTRRTPKLHNDDKGTVDVTLKYEHLLAGPNQSLFAPGGGSGFIYSKGKCSIREKETNFYYPFGIRTGPLPNGFPTSKVRLVVGHKYPLAPAEQSENAGKYLEQLGQVKVPFPESNAQFEGVLAAINPVAYARSLIASTNATQWMGEPALTWLCSEVRWQVLRPDTNLYHFGFEFQNNPDTWDPDITFLDSRTNLPPSTVAIGTIADQYGVKSFAADPTNPGGKLPAGAWTVPYLRRVDFNQAFSAFFEGGNDQLFL